MHLVSWRRKSAATHNFQHCSHSMNHLREAGRDEFIHQLKRIYWIKEPIDSHANSDLNAIGVRSATSERNKSKFNDSHVRLIFNWNQSRGSPIAAWNMTYISRSKRRLAWRSQSGAIIKFKYQFEALNGFHASTAQQQALLSGLALAHAFQLICGRWSLFMNEIETQNCSIEA